MKNEKRRKQNQKGGFTLVEMMVVLVIIGILAGLASWGFVGYQRSAAFKKNNEYAKTIFSAAQNALTYAKEAGQLDEMEGLLKSSGKTTLIPGTISGAYENEDLPADRIYSVIFTKGATLTGVDKTVYDMIDMYLYDEDVSDATFNIEFDPVDGVVWGVCYNDKATLFHYDGGASTEESNDISKRAESVRREILLGYYGVDMLSERAPGKAEKDLIQSAELINEDTLHLSWIMKDRTSDKAEESSYNVMLYKGTDAVCEFTVPPHKWTDLGTRVACDVTVKSISGGGDTVLKNIPFHAYKEKNAEGLTTLNIVLDAVDLEADTQVKGQSPDYKATYSILRLIPELLTNPAATGRAGEEKPAIQNMNLYAKIQAKDSAGLSKWKTTNTENALFASEGADKENAVVYGIANARHLYNIRFTEKAIEKAGADKKEIDYIYRQQDNAVWTGNVFNKGISVTAANFPAIASLGKKSSFIGAEEETKHKIIDLKLIEGGNAPLGLFAQNNGSIQAVTVESAIVKGRKYTGVVCGINAGELADITVDADSSVSGTKYVGGITGADITATVMEGMEPSISKERVYTKLKNAAAVEGESYVGGILGYNYGTYGDKGNSYAIKQCENTGFITATKAKEEEIRICIGGIAGYNRRSKIESCTSNPTPKKDVNVSKLPYCGSFVGGIVGFNRGGEIIDCVAGSKEGKGSVIGKEYVGGIAGVHVEDFDERAKVALPANLPGKGTVIVDGIETEKQSRSDVHVMGKKYVGGVVGLFGKLQYKTGKGLTDILMGEVLPSKLIVMSEIVEKSISDWIFGSETEEPEERAVVTTTLTWGGGITGINYGAIEKCNIGAISLGDEGEEFSLSYLIGGITGTNANKIAECSVKSVYSRQEFGGIAGVSSGVINDCTVGEAIADITETTTYRFGKVGGIVITNGTEGKEEIGVIKNCKVGTVEGRKQVAGIAAKNLGQIQNPTVGNVRGEESVGGIAGSNEGTIDKAYVETVGPVSDSGAKSVAGIVVTNGKTISNVEVESVSGTSNIAGVAVTSYGTGDITNVKIDSVSGTNEISGIVGTNSGKISGNEEANPDEVSKWEVGKVTGEGNVAGAVFKNESRGTISHVDVGSVTGINGVAGTANENRGSVVNVSTQEVEGKYAVAGTVVSNEGMVKQAKATLVTGDQDVGGIVSTNGETGSVIDSATVSTGVIAGGSGIGGIVAYNAGQVSGCTNAAAVSGSNIGGIGIGGIVAYNAGQVSGCTNAAAVSGSNIGGIVGTVIASKEITISSCINTGVIKATGRNEENAGIVGGIQGVNTVIIEKCDNYGLDSVDSTAYMSGILGWKTPDSKVTIRDCYGVAPVTYPITRAEGVSEDFPNYYFVKREIPPETEESGNQVDGQHVTLQKVDDGTNKDAAKVFDNKFDKDSVFTHTVPESGSSKLKLHFEGNKEEINCIDIYWLECVPGQTYSYKIKMMNTQDEIAEEIEVVQVPSKSAGSKDSKICTMISEKGPKWIEIEVLVPKGGEIGIREIGFNGKLVSLKKSLSISTQAARVGELGSGTPLYVAPNGELFDAWLSDTEKKIVGMPLDPTVVDVQNDEETKEWSEWVYGGLNGFIQHIPPTP